MFMIRAPISINLTVSTKVELTMLGCGFKESSTTLPGISCGIHMRLSNCSSTVGAGVLSKFTVAIRQTVRDQRSKEICTHVQSGT